LSLKEELEKEARDKEALAKYVQEALPKLLGAVQSLFRTLEQYLADVLSDGLATKDYGKTTLKPKHWDEVFFPVLMVSVRKQVIEIAPFGPVLGSRCRVDMSCGAKTFFLSWDGDGNGAEHWTIKSSERALEGPQQLTKGRFEHALQTLIELCDVRSDNHITG